MMSYIKTVVLLIILKLCFSCDNIKRHDNVNDKQGKLVSDYCGRYLTVQEINEIADISFQNNAFKEEGSSAAFVEMWDSINVVVDSIAFDLSLQYYDSNEIYVDVVVRNISDSKTISCKIMTSRFTENIPKVRKVRFFTKTDKMENGDSRIIMGITND